MKAFYKVSSFYRQRNAAPLKIKSASNGRRKSRIQHFKPDQAIQPVLFISYRGFSHEY